MPYTAHLSTTALYDNFQVTILRWRNQKKYVDLVFELSRPVFIPDTFKASNCSKQVRNTCNDSSVEKASYDLI